MPSNWLYIDTNFPTFTGQEKMDEKVTAIQNYMFMLVEQLRYTLHNLDMSNMNKTALSQFTQTLTDPIYAKLEGEAGELAALSMTAEALSLKMSDVEGNVTSLGVVAEGLAARVASAEGNVASLQLTADSLSSQIGDAQGNIATLKQTAASLTSQISGANSAISTLQQNYNSISASVSNLQTGMGQTLRVAADGVTITNASGSRLTIDGGQINANSLYVSAANVTGTLSAGNLRLNGLLAAYYGSSIYGYLGATTAGSLPGTALCDSTLNNYIIAATSGVRMSYHDTHQIWVASNGCWSSSEMAVYSDRRLKNSICYDMGRYDPFFDRLRPAFFKLDGEGKDAKYRLGFVAQDVLRAALDSKLSQDDIALLGRSENGYLGLSYGEFTALNTWEIQKLKRRVADLERKIAQ